MATLNIHKAKHKDGKAVSVEDIKVGVKLDFPSRVGGIISCICTELNDKEAIFESTNKDWPTSNVISFNEPELTLEEIRDLGDALKAYNSWNNRITSEQRALVTRADLHGYAIIRSYTQANWTTLGQTTFNKTT
jgi:hypothetical protein